VTVILHIEPLPHVESGHITRLPGTTHMAFFTDIMQLAVRNGTVLATAGHKSAADSCVYLTVVKDC
jgi:hypothetical protein